MNLRAACVLIFQPNIAKAPVVSRLPQTFRGHYDRYTSSEGRGTMSAVDTERVDARTAEIEQALGHIGERISEAEAAAEVCECRQGMFALAATRRQLFGGGGLIAAVGMTGMLPRTAAAKAPPGAVEYPVPADSTKEQGRMMGEDGGYGSRSQFETEVRWANPTKSAGFSPLQNSYGTITPSGLHYERHHGGIPNIDPTTHRLVIHGLVDRPIKYSLADLKRFPTLSRTYFMECSGTTGSEIMKAREPNVQRTHGLVSTSEWTGVPLSTLLKQAGLKPGAAWVLAEGADAAVMTRSVPIDKCLSDALVVFAQNGEAIRPEQGYPMRLFLPGWEGNISIKWLRRLEVSDKPFYTREETSKYTDLITTTGKARIFSFTMDAKSVITFPSGEMKLPGPGFYEITGLSLRARSRARSSRRDPIADRPCGHPLRALSCARSRRGDPVADRRRRIAAKRTSAKRPTAGPASRQTRARGYTGSGLDRVL